MSQCHPAILLSFIAGYNARVYAAAAAKSYVITSNVNRPKICSRVHLGSCGVNLAEIVLRNSMGANLMPQDVDTHVLTCGQRG